LTAAYLDFAEKYYVKDGEPTRRVEHIKHAIKSLVVLYGLSVAREFGPKSLKTLRQSMIEKGWSRTFINGQIQIVKQIFRWGVSEEILPQNQYHGLSTMRGLAKGRSEAREPKPIGPVADEVVDDTLPYLPAVVADMVRFQRLVGARPGEVCMMRPMDVDRSREIWEYRPASHKTEHHGKSRVVFIGPKAQAVLAPYLERDHAACCFSPAESEVKRRKEQRSKRKTKVQPSQRDRRSKNPRVFQDRYNKNSYRYAVCRAVKKANKKIQEEAEEKGIKDPVLIPHWHPNQLRHSAATSIRKQFGLEAAQVILGHSKADVTQIYAERDSAKAVEIVKQIG
jgi:integrase